MDINIVDHLGLVQLLRSLLMRFTILTRILRKKGINASVVGTQLKTYKAYKNFWMDLMVEMKLATQTSSSPVTIDM